MAPLHRQELVNNTVRTTLCLSFSRPLEVRPTMEAIQNMLMAQYHSISTLRTSTTQQRLTFNNILQASRPNLTQNTQNLCYAKTKETSLVTSLSKRILRFNNNNSLNSSNT